MIELINYIKEYGGYTFIEKPFNEIDNLIFSQIVYVNFEAILGDGIRMPLKDAIKEYHNLHTEDEIKGLIKISAKAVRLLDECSLVKRFADIQLCHYANYINGEIDKQFATVSYILDDNSIVVAFRGTDITVTGVKESAMLSYMFPVPAQIEALHHFQETCMLYDDYIIRICGHSKGGNLAVFAAVNCSNSLKKRIAAVYEDDAPGFPKWFFDRYDYQQIKDKIKFIVPEGSIIGRMLYHDAAPIVIKSTASGLKQHQISSWVIDGDMLLRAENFEHSSDFVSEYINNLIDYIGDDDLELFFDTIEYLVENIGIEDFYDLKSFDLKKLFALIDSHSVLNEKQKERFKQIVKKAFNDFAREFFSNYRKSFIDKLKNPTQ